MSTFLQILLLVMLIVDILALFFAVHLGFELRDSMDRSRREGSS